MKPIPTEIGTATRHHHLLKNSRTIHRQLQRKPKGTRQGTTPDTPNFMISRTPRCPKEKCQDYSSNSDVPEDTSFMYFQPFQDSNFASVSNTTKSSYNLSGISSKFNAGRRDSVVSNSLGYVSDLNEVMSTLSIEEDTKMPEVEEDCKRFNGTQKLKDSHSHLSLNDLKICDMRAYLKTHKDIRALIPSQGYKISQTQGQSIDHPQLENSLNIDSLEINIEETILKSGLRIFQISPIIFIQPCLVNFSALCPAVVQVPRYLDPSSGDEVFCLYSKSSKDEVITNWSKIQWSSEMNVKCWTKNGKVCFETLHSGSFVLVIRPKCTFSSSTKNIDVKAGGNLVVRDFPSVQVVFPEDVTEMDIISRANAKVHFDTEETVEKFLSHISADTDEETHRKVECLATPIIQLEPHGMEFTGKPVMITLPIPDYEKIKSLLGSEGELVIMQSNTHPSEPSKWEKLDVIYEIKHIEHSGETVTMVTFPVKHFSFFKGIWNTFSEILYEAELGMAYFFVSCAMKCQANMQNHFKDQASTEEKSNRFGLAIFLYRADRSPPKTPIFKRIVGEHITPKLVRPGKIYIDVQSNRIEADVEAGEEKLEEQTEFRGHDVEAQFMAKVKPGENIESGPFGKVVVSRCTFSRQKGQNIFKLSLQTPCNRLGKDEEYTDAEREKRRQDDMLNILSDFADCLNVTEGNNWKQFALECGISKQDMVDTGLTAESQPFLKIVDDFIRKGGTYVELFVRLYRSWRRLEVAPYSGEGRNFTTGSRTTRESGPFVYNFGSYFQSPRRDSNISGKGKTNESVILGRQKRSRSLSFGDVPDGSRTVSKQRTSKRRRLSTGKVLTCRRLKLTEENANSTMESEASELDSQLRKNQTKLSQSSLWKISRHIRTPKWRELGRTLELEETLIREVVEVNGIHQASEEYTYQMLLAWQQAYPSRCTFGNLYSALRDEGMNKAAGEICTIDIHKS